MTNARTEALAVIDEADASPPGTEFGRMLSKGFGGRYIYLRFKHGDGQPLTHVRVRVSKNVM
jgi:hypothetical protein